MRAVLIPLVLLACWIPVAAAQQPHAVEAVVIQGPVYETPPVTPLEVAQSLDAVRQEIAAAKETYGEESAQVRLLTEILHNLEGTFRQQLTDRGMIRTAGHHESAEHEEHEADDEEEEGEGDDEEEDEADESGEEHKAEEHAGQHRGHNDSAIARLSSEVRELRDEVEKLKQHVNNRRQVPQLHRTPTGVFQPHDSSDHRSQAENQPTAGSEQNSRRREYFRRMMEVQQQRGPQVDELHQARERIAQLERENAALRQQRGGAAGTPAGPRAERVLNALRDQTMQHQAEAAKRIEQSFEQMQRRLQELQQSQSPARPRADRPREQRSTEQRRPEERRREARPPRTSSAQPL